jgi:carboxymuconolactone decarboxylase
MKFGQRFSKNTFKSFLAALILTAGVVGAASTALAAGEPVTEEQTKIISASLLQTGGTVFPIGNDNAAYAEYFTGQSFLFPMANDTVNVANVTFAPSCINNWHTHSGSCQVLVGVSGRGYYQIWGQEPVEMKPGESVTIPEGTKHWHGAAGNSWFQHLSIMSRGAGTTWLEPVDQNVYRQLQ